MPWTTKDVDKHNKGLTAKQKRQWVAVANGALHRCEGAAGTDCEARAIKQANAAVAKKKEAGMPGQGVTINVTNLPGADSDSASWADILEHNKPDTELAEYVGSVGQFMGTMRKAFRNAFAPAPTQEQPARPEDLWVKDIYSAHPVLGDSVVVEVDNAMLYAVPYTVTNGSVTFAARDKWEQVLPTYVKVSDVQKEAGDQLTEADFVENAVGRVLTLAEQGDITTTERNTPLTVDVAVITPGWGNKRDNHYYPRKIVERDAGVFEGIKMYETDHRASEKSTRTWVSTVKEIKGFTEAGEPIAQVVVHDQSFAQRMLALAEADMLDKMECSILASGTSRKGKVDGRKGNIVEAITSAESVDWVTRAGAGGRALALAEAEQQEGEPMDKEHETEVQEPTEEEQEAPVQEAEPTAPEAPATESTFSEQEEPDEPPAPETLAEDKVDSLVEATKLPDAAKAKLKEGAYPDEEALQAAIDSEVAYIKEVTGSGKPFAQGGGAAPAQQEVLMTAEQADEDFNRIMREVGAQEV